MQLLWVLAPLSFVIGVGFAGLLCVALCMTCYWVVHPPSWLPHRWSVLDDWPRRFLLANLILQPLCLGFILLILLTYPMPVDPMFDYFVLTFLSGYGLLATILGLGLLLGAQVWSFPGWVEKALTAQPQSMARRLATSCLTTFLAVIFVWVIFSLGYRVPFMVLGLICAFGVGVAIVGVSPFYWLARKWEHQHQQKLILGPKRRIEAVDWPVAVE